MGNGLAIWYELGDPRYIALGLNFLIPTLIKLGRFEHACELLVESIQLCMSTRDHWGAGNAYRNLGLVKMAMGNNAEAQKLFRKSLETFRGFVTGYDIAISTIYLAQATLADGDLDEARRLFTEALCLAVEAISVPQALSAIMGLANVQAQSGQYETALEYSCFVQIHLSAPLETKECADQLRLQVEKRVTPQQADAAQKRALERSLESIVFETASGC